jgi:hypothetical protein
MTTSVRITDAFSEKINDLAASSTRVPGVLLPFISVSLAAISDNSNITGLLIHENRVVLPASAQTTTPNANSAVPSNESSLSATGAASVANHLNAPLISAVRDCDSSSAISNTCDEFLQGVSGVNRSQLNSMANSSALPSESTGMVAPGNHETTATEKSAPMLGAAKKSSKMRPGTTNTARCDCG